MSVGSGPVAAGIPIRAGPDIRATAACATGWLGAEMAVELVNDGSFTIWLDADDR